MVPGILHSDPTESVFGAKADHSSGASVRLSIAGGPSVFSSPSQSQRPEACAMLGAVARPPPRTYRTYSANVTLPSPLTPTPRCGRGIVGWLFRGATDPKAFLALSIVASTSCVHVSWLLIS